MRERVKIPRFRERVLWLLNGKCRPVLHGEIALENHCSLAQVEFELVSMLESGEIRRLSEDDLRGRGMDRRLIAYVLSDRSSSAG